MELKDTPQHITDYLDYTSQILHEYEYTEKASATAYHKLRDYLKDREETLLKDPVKNKKRLNEIQYILKNY